MRIALQIMSYVLGGIMLIGSMVLATEGTLDGYTFLMLAIILTQTILTLVFVHQNKK